MIRNLLAALAVMLPLAAHAQTEQQTLVDRATLAAQELLNDKTGRDAQSVLRDARAVMLCPRVFRAGFLLGGQGGTCVLVARDAAGSWSYPAFYDMGGGSIGFQAGIQDSEVMMAILTQRGLAAIMDNQFKIGADASIAVVTAGGGVEGATTAAVGADIVAFQRTRGLFAGISLSGTMLGSKTDWNEAYYGAPLAARQIVVAMQARNPGADPLREVLTRFGTPRPPMQQAGAYPPGGYAPGAAPGYPPAGAPPGYGAGPGTVGIVPSAPVQAQPLAPPRR